jgi:ubiquinol-cytochrome c reductase cytochrome b subunit
LPFYAILRSIPEKLGGVLAMGLAILSFFLINSLDYTLSQSSFFQPRFEFFVIIFFVIFFFLKILGAMPVEDPYYVISQQVASAYFIFLFIILPLLAYEDLFFHKNLQIIKN